MMWLSTKVWHQYLRRNMSLFSIKSAKKIVTFACVFVAMFAHAQSPTPVGATIAAGLPSTTRFNGLETIQDTLHRIPTHAQPARYMMREANTLPEIGALKTLGRRDSLIVYVPNVAGAADYRVRVAGGWRDVTDIRVRIAPRDVWACAGFRQRAWLAKEDANGVAQRELLQAIELPGLTDHGAYVIEVQALAEPCPFTGMPAHTTALIPMAQPVLQGLAGATIPYMGFADLKATYGAEIINGQLASSDWIRAVGQRRGQAVSPRAAQPIASSNVLVFMPFPDEPINAPILDFGFNSVFDDFQRDGIANNFTRIATRSFGGSDAIEGPFSEWYFWGAGVQAPQGAGASDPPLGVQVWQRHGRLNITMTDWSQDVFAATHFVSTKSGVQTLDADLYVHSFFRVDSGATGRRYWHWMMCGGDNADAMMDPATKIPKSRHLLRPAFYDYGGVNPTMPQFNETLTASHKRECLQLLQLAASNPNTPTLPNGTQGPAPNQTLIAVKNPADSEKGVVNLTPAIFDRGYGTNTINWRLDANNNYAGPIIEPFDQQQPLTHYDVFVRKNRMVLFVNGRQAHCWDMSGTPLTMNVGQIVYGQVLYHTDAEVNEQFFPQRIPSEPYRAAAGSFHYSLNTVAADHRAWDAIGHSEKLAIPALFNFDAGLCKLPGSVEAR
jgi:hypothetical protein